MIEGSTIRGIYEVNFRYNAKMEVYVNSRLGIPKLSKIANYGRLLKIFRKYLCNLGKYETRKHPSGANQLLAMAKTRVVPIR